MKILQLCKKFPYPLRDGESIANTYLSRALVDLGGQVSLLAMNTTKHFHNLEDLPEDLKHYSGVLTVDVDNTINALDAIHYLLRDQSYHAARYISREFQERLKEVLLATDFDIVQLETIYLAPYIPTIRAHSDALIVLRAHNVEHEIWDRVSDHTQFAPKKWYLKKLTHQLRDFESRMLAECDMVVTFTERDMTKFRQLGYLNGAMTSPIGIDLDRYPEVEIDPDRCTLAFIGALDWVPNIEGLRWFIDKVWPDLHATHPEIRCHIAGRNPSPHFEAGNIEGLEFHGEVICAADFIGSHSLMIVPLFSGGGMRVKILEGMAMGRVVITTSVGLEGIGAVHGQHLLVADTPQAFRTAISRCLEKPEEALQIGRLAKEYARQNFDCRNLTGQLYRNYKACLDTYRVKQ